MEPAASDEAPESGAAGGGSEVEGARLSAASPIPPVPDLSPAIAAAQFSRGAARRTTPADEDERTRDESRRRARLGTVLGVSALIVTVIGVGFTAWEFFGKTPAQLADETSFTPAPVVTNAASPSPSPAGPTVHVGWGPQRDTFTSRSPAPYAVLNSITDNPDVGDERNFVRIRHAGEGTYTDFLRVAPGDRLQLSVFVGNDAADNLDGTAATVHGLTAAFDFLAPGKDVGVSVVLSGKNVMEVWDGATVLADVPVKLRPVEGTLTMLTNAGRWDLEMGTALDRVVLGWDKPDGEFPVGYSAEGEYRGMGYLTMEVDVEPAG